MYPAKFDYYRANSVEEALDLLAAHEDAKLLAGGHSLVPVMKLRLSSPAALIDIGRIDALKGICKDDDGNVKIGALTTYAATAAANGGTPQAVTETASIIADQQVRNRGTIGGGCAHADPASDMPTVLTALGASFSLASKDGMRDVGATDFFTGFFETDLGEQEVMTTINVPAEGAGTGSAYMKLPNPASGYAMVGAAATITANGGTCESIGVAVGGLTAGPVKCSAVEAALVGKALTQENIAAATNAVLQDVAREDASGDMHASAEYRHAVLPTFIYRALTAAAERAMASGEGDDLTKIEGVGPKVAEILSNGGLRTFAQVAASSSDVISALLRDAGSAYNRMDPTTWPQQASLAAAGDWDALKTLQDELDGGRA